MKLDSQKVLGYALVALSACCFALMPIFARVAYDSGVDTTTLLLGRFLIGGIFLSLLAWAKRSPLPPKSSWPILFLLGLVGYTGTSFCYFTALNHASASLVALLLYAYPALVILLGFAISGEKLSRNNLLALLCASGGCMLVIGLSGKGDWRGIALALCAACAYSLYIIISSQVVGTRTAMASSAFIILSASLSYCCIALFKGVSLPQTTYGVAATLAIAFFSTVVAFWSFFAGLGIIGSAKASLVSTLEPLVTVLSAVLFLGESLTISIIAGGFLIVAGLVISALPSRLHKKNEGL
ncbi:DMT family transporter [Sphaerochaeta sp.]|uniref:DMT family transporter n=1 Tax=Sphaerochaeta sp. TaxID=1972642 RepID=UPI00258BE82B|nr:DMT family transporter [Sphaerochaeta sp.]MDD3457680.1 DMT family transporter [Sphaerochaeta sp.]